MAMNKIPPLDPLPPAQDLVLQPPPAPDPALVQPNWNVLSAALQTVATETAYIPHSNPMQQIITMNANMAQLVQTFNDLQSQFVASHNQVIASHNQVIASHNQVIARLDLVSMRLHNASARASSALQYPPGIGADPSLPVTLADAMALSASLDSTTLDSQYGSAIDHLVANNAPGLASFPGGPDVDAALVAKRQHFLGYLGCYI